MIAGGGLLRLDHRLISYWAHVRQHYDESNQKLICESIRLKYPVRDDIPVMLIDEAEKYNVSAGV